MNIPTTLPFVSKVAQTYQGATKGLQNYGKNLGNNIRANQQAFNTRTSNKDYYKSTNPFPNPFKSSSYK